MNLHHFRHNRFFRWLFRFRKRCGYGIHSPFAFNFVTGVIYEKGEYYAYADLIKKAGTLSSPLRLKDNRLLFRLVNFCQPNCGLTFSHHLGLTQEYLVRGKTNCNWNFCLSLDDFRSKLSTAVPSYDFIYVDETEISEELFEELRQYTHSSTFVLLRGIHSNPCRERVWLKWIADQGVRVTFDLFDFGMIFYEARLNKEDYIINYY